MIHNHGFDISIGSGRINLTELVVPDILGTSNAEQDADDQLPARVESEL